MKTGGKGAGKVDVYVDRAGDMHVKKKRSKKGVSGEPLEINVKDLKKSN